jgi:secernin
MRGDLVVALGRATVDGHTLFGQNSERTGRACPCLQVVRGRSFALGETVQTSSLQLPQPRQTWAVLGSRPHGAWGFQHGVNEHGVAVGRAPLRTRIKDAALGLRGTDLVRLALERSLTARQAVDLLTDLVSRHGQAPELGEAADGNVFLVADAAEAFAVEAAGCYWVYQEPREIRALGGLSTIRQDWSRIAPGLSEHAIAEGWWPADGSKLDFAAAVAPVPSGEDSPAALRRWGHTTLLLGEQNGHIDTAFLRRLLSDHPEGDDRRSGPSAADALIRRRPRTGHRDDPSGATAASLVVSLGPNEGRLRVAWCAFGPPCLSVYFPVFLEGDLPAAFTCSTAETSPDAFWWRLRGAAAAPGEDAKRRDLLARLQERFDQDADEFAAEGATLRSRGEHVELQRQATLFLQHCLERFEEAWSGLGRPRPAGADVPARRSPA